MVDDQDQIEEEIVEGYEEISPSFKEKTEKPKKPSPPKKEKEKAGKKAAEVAGKPAEKVAKKGVKQAALAAGRAIASAVSAAIGWLASVVGWPVLVGCLVIFLIIMIIFGGIACISINGYFGRTIVDPAGKNDPNVIALIAASKQKTAGDTYKFELPNQRDREFLESGQIDKRLAASLNYLVQRHEHIQVSHIVSAYEDMNINPESGSFHDIQIAKNISAHKVGTAADIDEIDFVSEKCKCGDSVPVQIAWQGIGENPYGEVPDALNQIKSPNDILSPEVKAALEKLGVTGLSEADLIAKMQAIPVLANITSVFDLTKPEVIAAFSTIGVNGIDNESLQTGLKRLQALQSLYDLNPSDITSLNDPRIQELLNTMGIPVSDELTASIKKYQATLVLQNITSLSDLQKPEVQEALKTIGVDATNADFQAALVKMEAAAVITSWNGNISDPKFLDALKSFGLTLTPEMQKALEIMKTTQNVFASNAGDLTTEAQIIKTLESLSVSIDSPDLQNVLNKFKAAYQLQNFQGNYSDPQFLTSLSTLGLDLSPEQKAVIEKYQASQAVLNYHGDYTDPQFLANLAKLGVPLNADTQLAIDKYKATLTLADAAQGKIAPESQAVLSALKTLGLPNLSDPKVQAAINIAKATDFNSPTITDDKNTLGLTNPLWLDTMLKFQAAKNLLNINQFSDFQNPQVQQSLQTLGLNDPKYFDALNKVGAAQELLSINNLSDLQKDSVQKALGTLGLDNPDLYKEIVKIGSLETLMQVDSFKDLQSPAVQEALKNLGITDPKVFDAIGEIGNVYTLLEINSVWDFTKPEVIDALGDLGLADPAMQASLQQAGSVYTLTQIKSPADLLKPESLKALSNLGVINLDSELLGQIGAIQTLMSVNSVGDLFNPSSILALNSLGIISLSNPVTTAIMVLSFLDNILGLGLFGDCKGSTACYKPTAQANVHKVIEELLQMPYDLKNVDYYRVVQLITYSEDRDVLPFSDKLDALYGAGHPSNLGLFAMPEALPNIHIGY